jgi:hypothetical protein
MIKEHITGTGRAIDPIINSKMSEAAVDTTQTDRDIERLQMSLQSACNLYIY